jgi:hypothetical protein
MFKKLLGAFVEFDEKEEPVEAVLQTTSAGLPVPQRNPAMPGVTPISTATHNEEIVNTIQTAVLSKKTAYTTFVEASMRLEAVIPDETTRMKAAFVTVTGDSSPVADNSTVDGKAKNRRVEVLMVETQ